MQCFKKQLVEDTVLRELYRNEFVNKQLFKTQTVIIVVVYSHPEYRIYVNNEPLAALQYVVHSDKILFIPVINDKQVGVIDIKTGTSKYISINESIVNIHVLQDQLVIVSTSNVLIGNISLVNSSTNIQPSLKVLANTTGVSCICDNFICIATLQGITMYTLQGKSHLVPLVGEKQDLIAYNQYLFTSGKIGYIYDVKSRYNAYTGPLPGKWVKSYTNKSIYLVHEQVLELIEKDIYDKVQQALKRDMFELGILLIEQEPASSFSLFNNQNVYDLRVKQELESLRLYNKEELKSEVYKLFANYTYLHDDISKAMQYYIETIGYLEPSVVILKYMNAQRIEPLMDYLEALHLRNVANADHTTLLLNCYSKSKSISRLDAFLKNVDNISFNPEVAIKVTREAGHIEQALQLCSKFKNHHQYVKILLEDKMDHSAALQYISHLEFTDCLTMLSIHGRTLVDAIPNESTDLFKQLCINYKLPPEQLLPYYRKDVKYLSEFLIFAVQELQVVSKKIWTALFEVCLEQDDLKHMLLTILKDPNAAIDENEVLLLCHTHGYNQGKLVLLKRMNLKTEIVHVYMDLNDHEQVLNSAIEYCKEDKSTWIDVLSYFSKLQDTNKLQTTLTYIENTGILTAIEVVQIFANDPQNKMSLIKDYLLRQFKNEQSKIQEYHEIAYKFEQDIDVMESELKQLKTEPILFQETICSACQQQLNLPIIHFYCHHSYHQSCLGESEQCPRCIEEYESPLSEENEKTFYQELEDADDAFSKMTDFMSRHYISTTPNFK